MALTSRQQVLPMCQFGLNLAENDNLKQGGSPGLVVSGRDSRYTTKICEKRSIQYTVLGFEPTTV